MSEPADWARRLSDRMRAALAAGDLAGARRLATEGDGQARSLEKEYTLMYRGLGITLRVLLDLVPGTLARLPSPAAALAVVDLLARFRTDMRALVEGTRAAGVGGRDAEEASPAGPAAVDAALGETRRALAETEARFLSEQSRLAREVVAALDAGDAATARRLLDVKEREGYVPPHDRMIRFMADMFAWVLRQGGPGELLRFHLATAEAQREGFERWERLPPADFARATVFLLKQHMGEATVTEDAERFTIVQTPCGSGGRLRTRGAYAGPGALPFVEEAGPLTLGEPALAVYCTHCPIWNGLAPLGWFGHAQWVFDRPAREDGSCTVHVYKRPADIPPDYARRLGHAAAAPGGPASAP